MPHHIRRLEKVVLPLARKVFFLTGIRSEYDIFAPVIEAVSTHAGLEPGVIATGAHLCADFGYTIRQIEADGFPIVSRIDSLLRSDGLSGRVKGAALQIAGLSDLLANNRPDFLAVMGDREESITGALAGAYHHVPVVHLGGGDHADDANVDNLVRHAVTKLSHLHMAASDRSAARILGLCEEPWRVHMTGASGLDRIVSTLAMSRDEVMQGLGVAWGDSPFLVLIYHPTITDFADSRAHMAMILETLERVGEKIVILFPNSDPGNGGVIEALQAFVARSRIAIAAPFLERRLFVNMLRQAACLVGNSSAASRRRRCGCPSSMSACASAGASTPTTSSSSTTIRWKSRAPCARRSTIRPSAPRRRAAGAPMARGAPVR